MSYLINEIYELYEKHLEITEPVLKNMGVEDNIHNYLIDVNIDLEILLESNDIIRYEHDELQDKIKQAYDEIFKIDSGIKDILVSKHPKLADEIYITYTSPFWKVRVGNCATNDKAQELRRAAF